MLSSREDNSLRIEDKTRVYISTLPVSITALVDSIPATISLSSAADSSSSTHSEIKHKFDLKVPLTHLISSGNLANFTLAS